MLVKWVTQCDYSGLKYLLYSIFNIFAYKKIYLTHNKNFAACEETTKRGTSFHIQRERSVERGLYKEREIQIV